MLVLNRPPVDYRLCNQPVTVYHPQKDSRGQISGVEVKAYRGFLDFKKVRNVDKTGSSEASSFLLVIPGDRQTVYPGDRVLLGEGSPIAPEQWKDLIPSKVPGLCAVKYADLKYWNGQPIHTEAGG